jgi:hypothetical protein
MEMSTPPTLFKYYVELHFSSPPISVNDTFTRAYLIYTDHPVLPHPHFTLSSQSFVLIHTFI